VVRFDAARQSGQEKERSQARLRSGAEREDVSHAPDLRMPRLSTRNALTAVKRLV
jgi:hypothetical protein